MPNKNKSDHEVVENDTTKQELETPESEILEDASVALEDDSLEHPQKSETDVLKEDLALMKDRYLRLAADFENYKKIAQREQISSIKFANESIITNLLPVLDNLEQAVKACAISGDTKSDVLVGVEMVLKQFVDLLQKFGVEVFSAQGAKFDPTRHEALSEQEDNNVEPGTVILEYQKGYLFNGRLLRPARVVVAKRSST